MKCVCVIFCFSSSVFSVFLSSCASSLYGSLSVPFCCYFVVVSVSILICVWICLGAACVELNCEMYCMATEMCGFHFVSNIRCSCLKANLRPKSHGWQRTTRTKQKYHIRDSAKNMRRLRLAWPKNKNTSAVQIPSDATAAACLKMRNHNSNSTVNWEYPVQNKDEQTLKKKYNNRTKTHVNENEIQTVRKSNQIKSNQIMKNLALMQSKVCVWIDVYSMWLCHCGSAVQCEPASLIYGTCVVYQVPWIVFLFFLYYWCRDTMTLRVKWNS